jgi:hypothetical protein
VHNLDNQTLLGAWSRRPLSLAVHPLAASGDTLAETKDGTHQAAVGVAGQAIEPTRALIKPCFGLVQHGQHFGRAIETSLQT